MISKIKNMRPWAMLLQLAKYGVNIFMAAH
jgi:hypothetical protein